MPEVLGWPCSRAPLQKFELALLVVFWRLLLNLGDCSFGCNRGNIAHSDRGPATPRGRQTVWLYIMEVCGSTAEGARRNEQIAVRRSSRSPRLRGRKPFRQAISTEPSPPPRRLHALVQRLAMLTRGTAGCWRHRGFRHPHATRSCCGREPERASASWEGGQRRCHIRSSAARNGAGPLFDDATALAAAGGMGYGVSMPALCMLTWQRLCIWLSGMRNLTLRRPHCVMRRVRIHAPY